MVKKIKIGEPELCEPKLYQPELCEPKLCQPELCEPRNFGSRLKK